MNRILTTGIATAALALSLCQVNAADKPGSGTNAGQSVTVTGTVRTIRDDDGTIKAVGIVTADNGIIKVLPDAKAKELGENAGKNTEAKGSYTKRAGITVLVVTEFRII